MNTVASDTTVIVPTLAATDRETQIRRCVESIRRSSRLDIQIIVVVNGQRYDDAVCAWLDDQADVRLEWVSMPSAPNAVFHGRKAVATRFFSTIDDDDEYLDGGTDVKLASLESFPEADIVITNGYRCTNGIDELIYSLILDVPGNPLIKLFNQNWLNSCNALYRSSSIGPDYFVDYHPYLEWTWLAFRLAIDRKKFLAIEQPTFRVNVTPGSVSTSDAYADARLPLYRLMLKGVHDGEVACLIRKRMSSAWHDHSVRALHHDCRLEALRCHLHSLCLPGGLRYLTYSRRLIPGWPNENSLAGG